jgi:multiple sugar transport system permease protein
VTAVTVARRRPAAVRARGALGTGAFHVAGMALALGFLFPLVWSFVSSFKTTKESGAAPPTWFPSQVSVDNYAALMSYGAGLPRYAANSLVVAAVTVVGAIVLSTLGGYGFARFSFPGKNLLFAVVIAVLMVPQASLVLPLYMLLGRIGLQNSLVGVGLALVVFQLPFSIFLMRNSFEAVPREMEEAALVDGCSNFGTFRHIALPIVAPGVVTVALFAFLGAWNEFLIPLVLLSDGSKFTMPLMLSMIRSGEYGAVNWGLLHSGTVVAVLPCLVLYLLLQRFYVSGLVSGALRG